MSLPRYKAVVNGEVVFDQEADLVKVPVPGKPGTFMAVVKHDRAWTECNAAFDEARLIC